MSDSKLEEMLETLIPYAKANDWSKDELAQFLAQTDHESAGFTKMKEMAYRPERAYQVFPRRFKTLDFAKKIYKEYGSDGLFEVMYGNRKELGNTEKGDGSRYIGRGPLGVTGKHWYQKVKDITGIDTISNPEYLEDITIGTLSAFIWWMESIPRNANFKDTDRITKYVNAGSLGLADRKEKFAKWTKILKAKKYI